MARKPLQRYTTLLESFVDGKLSYNKFIITYLNLFQYDSHQFDLTQAEFRLIERVFFAIDEYHPEPELSQISEEQFQSEVREALEQLRELDEESSPDDSAS